LSTFALLAFDPKWTGALTLSPLTRKQTVILCICCRFGTPIGGFDAVD
jgi:hypothetical protein